tara:strand:- start:23 stop:403 length:381 start_codon:yes stop_codon:yes gene_type:complete
MKIFILLFIATYTNKIKIEVKCFFSSNNIDYNVTDSLDKPISEYDYLSRTMHTGLDLKEIINKTEEEEQMIRLNIIHHKNMLLQKLLSDISMFEKVNIIEKQNIFPDKVVDITAGGLLNDWEFPEF